MTRRSVLGLEVDAHLLRALARQRDREDRALRAAVALGDRVVRDRYRGLRRDVPASRRGKWHKLLAATFVTVAITVPVLVVSSFVEVYVSPHLLLALSG